MSAAASVKSANAARSVTPLLGAMNGGGTEPRDAKLVTVDSSRSGAVAISAVNEAAGANIWISKGAGAVAAGLAAVNIFGGFLVTQRMLAMYRKKERAK